MNTVIVGNTVVPPLSAVLWEIRNSNSSNGLRHNEPNMIGGEVINITLLKNILTYDNI
jgi:hypothetical protein